MKKKGYIPFKLVKKKEREKRNKKLMASDMKAVEAYLKGLNDEKEVATINLRTFDGSSGRYTLKLTNAKGKVLKHVKREACIVLFQRHLMILERGRGKFIFSTHFLNLKDVVVVDGEGNDTVRLTFYGDGDRGDTNNGFANPLILPDENVTLIFTVAQSEDKQKLVGTLYDFYTSTFPGSPFFFSRRFTQAPPRMLTTRDSEPKAAGRFLTAYRAVCEWVGEPMCKELVWDLRHMYLSKKATEFNTHFMRDRVLTLNSLYPIFYVLGLNSFFTTLRIAGVRITRDIANCVGWMIRNNHTISTLALVSCDLNSDCVSTIADALNTNSKGLPLTSLDLSSNPLGDKGFDQMASAMRAAEFRLVELRVANCNGGFKGLVSFVNSISKNPKLSFSLKKLDLSLNDFSELSAANALTALLAKSAIEKLTLRRAKANFGGLSNCNTRTLTNVDLYGNCLITPQKIAGLTKMLTICQTIKVLSIAACDINAKGIDELCRCNYFYKIEELDISDNDILGIEGLTLLIKKLYSSKSLNKLNISRCFDKDPRHVKDFVDALSGYVTSMYCPAHIEMAGGNHPLGSGLSKFVLGLVNNKRIKYIDISYAHKHTHTYIHTFLKHFYYFF